MTARSRALAWRRSVVEWSALACLGLAILPLLAGDPVQAQSLTIDLGGDEEGSFTSALVQMILLLTVLSLAPSILVMVTSFTRIVIVLSFLRSAIGLQQSPPNPVLVSLALFLTLFIMAPAFERSWEEGIAPLINEEIDERAAFERAVAPLHEFMRAHVREKDLELFVSISQVPLPESLEAIPLRILVPAFMTSELRRAFEIGFLIFIPFVVIDLVVAAILMSMGMMMLPPVMISLPFKLIFFVLIDGWYLLIGSLVRSFQVA